MSIDEKVRRREARAIREANRDTDPHDELYQAALHVLYSIGLILAGFVLGMYASAVRTQAAEKVPVAPRCEYVGQIPESWPVENLPDAIDGTIHTASEAEQEPAERWESLGVWKLTAYCHGSCCNGRNAGRTASGAPMTDGRTVAVGHLPFGTHLLIDGHEYVVEDRGVRGNHVDILFPDHKSANRFGVKRVEVFIKR